VIELDGEVFGLPEDDWRPMASIDLNRTKLCECVTVCRDKWRKVIEKQVEGPWWRSTASRPFYESYHLTAELCEEAGRELAVAGRDLFNLLFLNGSEDLEDIKKHLVEALSKRDCIITIYSEEFFVPWGMLYVHPPEDEPLGSKGQNWTKSGFIGYRHVIEHATDAHVPVSSIQLPGGLLSLGFTFDNDLEVEQSVKSIAQQKAFFENHGAIQYYERRTKEELEAAFRQLPFPDQISYFFLHSKTAAEGTAEAPKFYLGPEEVQAAEIQAWTGGNLASEPFFFFNACQAGQMMSLFFESFALILLQLKARGLIGPQIDVPTLFAEEYARRFFTALLDRSPSSHPIRIGLVMRQLAQDFLDKDHNPIGLAYSLFKGADCYVSLVSSAEAQ
jgi:hypothetical protein